MGNRKEKASLCVFASFKLNFFFVWIVITCSVDDVPFLMVVKDTTIFGIPLDPSDPSNNAMAPVSGISEGQDIDYDDQQQLTYFIQGTVSFKATL